MDAAGNAYVTGDTSSTNFPTTPGAFQATYGGAARCLRDEAEPDGTALVYSTYLGGSGDDSGDGIAVDAAGNAYVTGYTDFDQLPDHARCPSDDLRGGNTTPS